MAKAALDNLMQDLHRIAGLDALREHSDAVLLARFASQRDEAAFAALVWRHGGLIFGVCRRMLPIEQDAEDAFQATFLTLARKAGSISNKESLAAWLYRVAFRIALRARKKTPLPLSDAAMLDQLPARETGCDLEKREILQSLDEEIAKLPKSSARAIILCYFEGKTHEEAALMLGCPKGTLASGVARARQQLHERLTKRGCALTAAGLGTLLAEQASAAPAEWIPLTTKAAVAFVSGGAVLSANAALLSEGMLKIMWFNKMKMLAAIALVLLTFGVGAGFLANSVWGGFETPAEQKADTPQGNAQAEIAKLRDEIAKLRAELKDAVKEIKSLKEALPEKAIEAMYKGKPASFWLEQLKDADSAFRSEAVRAIGSLANQNKKLVPILLKTLVEESNPTVARTTKIAVAGIGSDVLPTLVEIAKDKKGNYPKHLRQRAVETIGFMKAEAKFAVPELIAFLKETNHIEIRDAAVDALNHIGPPAKEAIPELIEMLDISLRDVDKKAVLSTAQREFSKFESSLIGSLCSIDRNIPEIMQDLRIDWVIGDPEVQVRVVVRGTQQQWRNAVESLKKKYPTPK